MNLAVALKADLIARMRMDGVHLADSWSDKDFRFNLSQREDREVQQRCGPFLCGGIDT
ncbi:MAG: hypothetical protein P8Q36_18840 [Alphaproteobacteria bacterium]|jgi:hypothetical protein|nr:hypothetical protein [Rhodospirillaceae bacterium]MBT7612584.1 hypothetical protein [Rhodospirillaceae bacterium]MDG2482897.1 hypothetical protein [Alphaproteobacteria bacterium]